MKGKICLITGGNAGIGKATASSLASKGGTVIIVSRSEEKGKKAVDSIRAVSGNDAVDYLVADLSSLKSVNIEFTIPSATISNATILLTLRLHL